MKTEEIALIQSKQNAAIIAPAGHGKTEMITDLVDKLPGKKLVLTHTNAGVDALYQRFERKNVKRDKYTLSTISSFCMTWCSAYPSTAKVNPNITMIDESFYPMVHSGAVKVFSHEWARNIIRQSYMCVIVDEYQDCVLDQHSIFVELNKTVPVYVLGDPLQAIFGFKDQLVSWKNLNFEVLEDEIETYPWRWEKTNKRLGLYLSNVRRELLPGLDGNEVILSTTPVEDAVYRINSSNIHEPKLPEIINQYKSVLYIAKWPSDTIAFAKNTGGKFQNDETQNLQDLYKYAQRLDDDDGYTRATTLFEFISECASGVATELKSYKKHIDLGDFDFHLIRKYPEFGKRLLRVFQTHTHNDMLSLLEWIKGSREFHLYRRELFSEMQRSIRRSRDYQISITQAAKEIRMIPRKQSKYSNFKYLSSRTLLSKGLEFECVIIDLSKVNKGHGNRYSSTEMYVAMTRATKAIFFITDKNSIRLCAPKGIL